jgi:tetratricopeptide (TPR) repeat protein
MTILAFAAIFQAASQQLTAVKQNEIVAFNGKGKYGMIIIRYHNVLNLAFNTNQGEGLFKKVTTEKKGTFNETSIIFDVETSKGASLMISEPEFLPVSLTVNLTANEAQVYFIDDPGYAETKSCAERNRLLGNKYFQTAVYERAREAYEEALKCWTMEDGERSRKAAADRLAAIDSITKLTAAAQSLDANNKSKVKEIYDLYNAAYSINPDDMELYKKNNAAYIAYTSRCNELVSNAEFYYNKKEFAKAKKYYQDVIDFNCPSASDAEIYIERINDEQNYLHHVLTYEYNKNAPVGISSGNYHQKGVGGYFTLRFDPKIFESFRSDSVAPFSSEANVSFGWTFHTPLDIKDVFGLWAFFGPGATAVFEVNGPVGKFLKEGEVVEPYDKKYTTHFAFSPEVGLLGKIRIAKKDVLAIRYTLQYRYSVKKTEEDYFGGRLHSVIGVGFCF